MLSDPSTFTLWLQFRKAFKQVAIIKLNETQWGALHTLIYFHESKIFFQRLQFYFSPAVLYYDQFIRKLLDTIDLHSRRLINSTFAGQATLGACCRIINTATWPQSRETNGLCVQKGKNKDLRADHDSYLKNLEKLILTPLVTVTDCWFLGSLGVQRSKQCCHIQSYEVLHCSAVAEVWVTAPRISDLADFPPHTLNI